MDVLEAVLLGVAQGLTEFLPVSSSGHLVILQRLVEPGEQAFFFDVTVHAATLLAVLVYFRREVVVLAQGLVGRRSADAPAIPCDSVSTLWYCLVVGTIPAVLTGVLLRSHIVGLFDSSHTASVFLLLTGAFLLLTRAKTRGIRAVSLAAALLIGLAQAFAILPGVSRSGWTIGAAIFLGVERKQAVQFSFLLSIPAIAGAFVYELLRGGNGVEHGVTVPLVVGAVCAFAAGILAIRILFSLSARGRLEFFGVYCLGAGLLSLVLL